MDRSLLERTLATRLSPTTRAWQRLADQRLASLGVSNSTGWCLVYLDRLGPDLSQKELAHAIGITTASLVRTLDQLEQSGLIVRVCDPDDRRANRLRLTEAGLERAKAIETLLARMRSELLADMPDADIEAALRVCDVLTRRIADWRIDS